MLRLKSAQGGGQGGICAYKYCYLIIRCGYSRGAWGAVPPIKLNQWDAWSALFFLKSGLYWDKF